MTDSVIPPKKRRGRPKKIRLSVVHTTLPTSVVDSSVKQESIVSSVNAGTNKTPLTPSESFDKLLEWSMASHDNPNETSHVLKNAPSRMQAFTMIAAQTNMSRVGSLHKMLHKIDDAVLDKLDEMTPAQLIMLRERIEADLSMTVNKMLPKSEEGNNSVTQIMAVISGNAGPATQSASNQIGLSQESRQKVRNFVQGVVGNTGLKVVSAIGEEKK